MASFQNEENEDNNMMDSLPAPSHTFQDSQESSQDSDLDEPTVLGPCSTDAGHPRMIPVARLRAKAEKENRKDAYCPECDAYFLNTIPALEEHFRGHKTEKCKPCQYCKKPTHSYYVRNKQGEPRKSMTYHKCHHNADDVPSTAPTVTGNDMNCNEIQPEPIGPSDA